MFERYNVVDPDGPTPGRYPPQRGFGWTNGVYAAALTRIVLGVRSAHAPPAGVGALDVGRSLPTNWRGNEIRVHLPRYPWPVGTPQNPAPQRHA
jgi:hypothetical protein